MDIEQLKLIIDAIKGLAGDTKQVAIVYFAFVIGKTLLGYGTGIFVVWFLGTKVYALIIKIVLKSPDNIQLSLRNAALEACWRAWLFNDANIPDAKGVTPDEWAKICKILGVETAWAPQGQDNPEDL